MPKNLWSEALTSIPPGNFANSVVDIDSITLSDEELRNLGIEPDSTDKKPFHPTIVNLAKVVPEEVSFLWCPYIPLGKLTLLEGDPGLGKTFLALNICAAISNGWPLPGPDGLPGTPLDQGNILFMTAEDGLADTLAPRLEKMGADRNKIYCLTGWKLADSDEEQAFTLSDVNVLRAALDQVKPLLVVIDPLQAYMGGIDMHRANETRPLLSTLGRIAEEYNCAVLAIRHLSKGGGTKALYRGLGSIDFTAAARSILLVGQDHTTGKKAMIHTKSSCAEVGKTLSFEINAEKGFLWGGLSDCTAEDILAPPTAKEEPSLDSALDEAKEYLLDALQDGPVKGELLLKEGTKETGVSKRTFHRAKKDLDIKSEKKPDGWYWYIPTSSRLPNIDDGNLGNLDFGPDISNGTRRLPTLPNEKRGTLDSWLDIGTEIDLSKRGTKIN